MLYIVRISGSLIREGSQVGDKACRGEGRGGGGGGHSTQSCGRKTGHPYYLHSESLVHGPRLAFVCGRWQGWQSWGQRKVPNA